MSFSEKFEQFKNQAQSQRPNIHNEEAMKTSIVLPFFQLLGFNPFDANEVVPEYTADFGTKKGEKVDYALKLGDEIAILIECKTPNMALNSKHAEQLFRYFTSTDARFAILTNGVSWEFYSDLDNLNKMDKEPFFRFELDDADSSTAEELSKFHKDTFDPENIRETASNLKTVRQIKEVFRSERRNPSEELVRALIRKDLFEVRWTEAKREEFASLVKRGISEVIEDEANTAIKQAIIRNTAQNQNTEDLAAQGSDDGIITTEEEWTGFHITKAIAAQAVEPERVVIRDQKSYCGVLLDDNNRKPLIRLWFNGKSKKYISLFDGDDEEKIGILKPRDIYHFADRIRATAQKY